MSYGMEIFDSTGTEIFSTTDSTWTLLGDRPDIRRR